MNKAKERSTLGLHSGLLEFYQLVISVGKISLLLPFAPFFLASLLCQESLSSGECLSAADRHMSRAEMANLVGGTCPGCCPKRGCLADKSCESGNCATDGYICKPKNHLKCRSAVEGEAEPCSSCSHTYDNQNPLYCGEKLTINFDTGKCTVFQENCGERSPNTCTETPC